MDLGKNKGKRKGSKRKEGIAVVGREEGQLPFRRPEERSRKKEDDRTLYRPRGLGRFDHITYLNIPKSRA